jgi:hypothetical protein
MSGITVFGYGIVKQECAGGPLPLLPSSSIIAVCMAVGMPGPVIQARVQGLIANLVGAGSVHRWRQG